MIELQGNWRIDTIVVRYFNIIIIIIITFQNYTKLLYKIQLCIQSLDKYLLNIQVVNAYDYLLVALDLSWWYKI